MTGPRFYPTADQAAAAPPCAVCGAPLDVETCPIPGTDRVDVVMATCTADVTHNPANAAAYGGRLEVLGARP